MYDIFHLATLTAERARKDGLRPNQVVFQICKEQGIPDVAQDDVKTLILRECGRRGGSKKPRAPRGSIKKTCQLDMFVSSLSKDEHLEDARNHEASLTAGIPAHDL